MIMRSWPYLAAALILTFAGLLLTPEAPLRAQSKVVIDNNFEWENIFFEGEDEDEGKEFKLKVGDTALFKKFDTKEQFRWAFDFVSDQNAARDRHLFYVYSLGDFSDESIVSFREQLKDSGALAALVTTEKSESDIGLGKPVKWTEAFADFLQAEVSSPDHEAFQQSMEKMFVPTSRGKIGKVVVYSDSYASKVPTGMVEAMFAAPAEFEYRVAVDQEIKDIGNIEFVKMVSSEPAWPLFDGGESALPSLLNNN